MWKVVQLCEQLRLKVTTSVSQDLPKNDHPGKHLHQLLCNQFCIVTRLHQDSWYHSRISQAHTGSRPGSLARDPPISSAILESG